MKFKDIPQFTRSGSYQVNIPWIFLKKQLNEFVNELHLQLNPDFQRGHVWTKEQQIAYVEFILRGGKSARTIYFNHPHWNYGDVNETEFVCVDGLQRLTAALAFLHNEITAFGYYYKDYTDKLPIQIGFIFNVNDLNTRAEVLQWYIEMNSGGTPHKTTEIERVKSLLEKEISIQKTRKIKGDKICLD